MADAATSKDRQGRAVPSNRGITVAIPTVRAGPVVAAIESVRRQTMDDWELLVLAQGEGDELRSLAEHYASIDERIRCVWSQQRGLNRARNRAMQVAFYSTVAFLDDDCEADARWLECITAALDSEADIGIVAGALVAEPSSRWRVSVCPVATPEDFTHRADATDVALPAGADFAGANLAVRRDAWRRTGGFDEALGPGAPFDGGCDLDFMLRAMRAGVAVRFLPSAVVHHTSGRRYGARAVYGHVRAYGRGQGAVAAKMVLDPGSDSPAWDGAGWRRHIWRQSLMEPLRHLRPDQAVRGLPRLLGFEAAYRQCLRDFDLDHEGRLARKT